MDCRTARLLIEFDRPAGGELEPADAGALENHLGGCPDCDALARAERQADDRLGRAMRQVEPPPGLRRQILDRLEQQRGDWHRRRFGHALRAAAAAAAVLLLVWGGWRLFTQATRPAIDVNALVEAGQDPNLHPGPAEVEAYFKRLGVNTAVPPNLNYAFLTSYKLAELPGRPGTLVPQLVFTQNNPNGPFQNTAIVYIVSDKQFNLDTLQPAPPPADSTQVYHLTVEHQPGEPYAYLILHTGDNFDWLKAPEPAAA